MMMMHRRGSALGHMKIQVLVQLDQKDHLAALAFRTLDELLPEEVVDIVHFRCCCLGTIFRRRSRWQQRCDSLLFLCLDKFDVWIRCISAGAGEGASILIFII
jgi:hypothetical protein